jgi:hypothetical protein
MDVDDLLRELELRLTGYSRAVSGRVALKCLWNFACSDDDDDSVFLDGMDLSKTVGDKGDDKLKDERV